ncbi:MAG: ATP-binding protein [Clostridiales bacterium]|nr:ATP-binding protein [Clostridiales bacterium]
MIKRELYMNKIRPFMDKQLVKVLTGIRRCGKSVMLKLIQDELKDQGAKENQFLDLNFEDMANLELTNAETLHKVVMNKSEENSELKYLFFDEIQEVKDWEKCINSLLSKGKFDIYITGSNAKLLSGELATYLSGRYIEIHIYPFSYREFLELYYKYDESKQVDDRFNRYIEIGGFPFISHFAEEPLAVSQYLKDIYNSVLIKDVMKRNQYRDVDLLERILLYVIAHIGETFSANSISKYFKSEGRRVAPETVLNQLTACEDAFLFHRLKRFDIAGKQILQFNEKFYIADHGLRQAIYGNNQRDVQRVLENIIYMEMLRRGYTIHVGRVGNMEVDFVCEREDQRIYLQIAYLLASDETIEREFGSLLAINDNYPKYVLTMDKFDMGRQGIIHRYIPDFLISE